MAAKTPSRNLSRNTSYDNLLRSPLVGQGIGLGAGSPLPRGFGGGPPRLWTEEGGRCGEAGVNGVAEAKTGSRHVWRWGQAAEGILRTPRTPSKGAGFDGSTPRSAKGGIRKEKERDIPPPLTASRMRRRNAPSGPSPLSRGGVSPAVTVEPSPASSRVLGFHRRSGSSCSSVNNGDEVASMTSSQQQPVVSLAGVGGGGGGSNSELGAPPKTPMNRRVERCSPPGTAEVTRKARKLAMMAMAAESAGSMPGGGGNASCQDLLALANAAAAGEKPPAPPPRRGKLMRYLSQDGGLESGGFGLSTPGRGRLMRLVSKDMDADENGGAGVPGGRRSLLTLRRANSLSAAEASNKSATTPIARGDIGQVDTKPGRTPRAKRGDSGARVGPRVGRGDSGARPCRWNSGARASRGDSGAPPLDRNSSGSARVAAASAGSALPDAAATVSAPSPRARVAKTAAVLGRERCASNAVPGSGARDTRGSSEAAVAGVADVEGVPSADVNLGVPLEKVSSLMGTDDSSVGDEDIFASGEYAAAQATVGAEAVVRDCLYNSHGMVALDGYLWKPGAIRLVRRWMMLVDNTLYYFVRPGYVLLLWCADFDGAR